MVQMAARSALKAFFPVDVIPVVIPVAAAAGLFSWMMTRTIVADPDGHSTARAGIEHIDDKAAESRGEKWRGSIRSYFSGRVAAGSTSVFPNKV